MEKLGPEHQESIRTRLQEIALAYVERYWARLHTDDRLAVLRSGLTAHERQALLREETEFALESSVPISNSSQ